MVVEQQILKETALKMHKKVVIGVCKKKNLIAFSVSKIMQIKYLKPNKRNSPAQNLPVYPQERGRILRIH